MLREKGILMSKARKENFQNDPLLTQRACTTSLTNLKHLSIREAKNNNTKKKMNGKRYLISFEMKKTMREMLCFVRSWKLQTHNSTTLTVRVSKSMTCNKISTDSKKVCLKLEHATLSIEWARAQIHYSKECFVTSYVFHLKG